MMNYIDIERPPILRGTQAQNLDALHRYLQRLSSQLTDEINRFDQMHLEISASVGQEQNAKDDMDRNKTEKKIAKLQDLIEEIQLEITEIEKNQEHGKQEIQSVQDDLNTLQEDYKDFKDNIGDYATDSEVAEQLKNYATRSFVIENYATSADVATTFSGVFDDISAVDDKVTAVSTARTLTIGGKSCTFFAPEDATFELSDMPGYADALAAARMEGASAVTVLGVDLAEPSYSSSNATSGTLTVEATVNLSSKQNAENIMLYIPAGSAVQAGYNSGAATLSLTNAGETVNLGSGETKEIVATTARADGGMNTKKVTLVAPVAGGKDKVTLEMDQDVNLKYGEEVTLWSRAKYDGEIVEEEYARVTAPADNYQTGKTDGANSLTISPSSAVTLGYGKSQAVIATTTKGDGTLKSLSVRITAPPEVTVSSVGVSSENYTSGMTLNATATVKLSDEKESTHTITVDATKVYNAGKNSVTLSSAGWVHGCNVVSASNGESVTVDLPPFTVSGGETFNDQHKTTVYFRTPSVENEYLKSKEVDATSVYDAGVEVGYANASPNAVSRVATYNPDTNAYQVTVIVTSADGSTKSFDLVDIDASAAFDAGYAAAKAATTVEGGIKPIENVAPNTMYASGWAYARVDGERVASTTFSVSTKFPWMGQG